MTRSSISSQEAAKRAKLGDDYKKQEMEKLIRLPVSVNPKLLLDQVPTSMILDYLKLYRNQRI